MSMTLGLVFRSLCDLFDAMTLGLVFRSLCDAMTLGLIFRSDTDWGSFSGLFVIPLIAMTLGLVFRSLCELFDVCDTRARFQVSL